MPVLHALNHFFLKRLPFFGGLLLVSVTLFADDPRLNKHKESFETGISENWVIQRRESATINKRFAKDGQQSLQWDWLPGESVLVHTPLAPYSGVRVPWTYPALSFWLYQPKACAGKLTLSFLDGEDIVASKELDLNFSGWELVMLQYRFLFPTLSGKERIPANAIRFTAPREVAGGPLIIDHVVFDAGTDALERLPLEENYKTYNPSNEKLAFDKQTKESSRALTAAESDALAIIRERMLFAANNYLSAQTARNHYQKHIDHYNAMGLTKDIHGVYSTTGKHLTKYPDVNFMLRVAKLYHIFKDDSEKRNILGMAFCNLYQHIFDEGGIWKVSWYGGYPLAISTFLMRDVLKENDLLDDALKYIEWGYSFDKLLVPESAESGSARVNMDYLGMDVPASLLIILCQSEPWTQVCYLRKYRQQLSQDILCSTNRWGGFRPDGSAHHHAGHYYAYLRYCGAALTDVIYGLSGTEFAISQDAFERVKKVYLSIRFCSNEEKSPNMGGRHPFASQFDRLRENSRPFKNLALSNPSLTGGGVDHDLAGAYLRIRDIADGTDDFGDAEIKHPPPTDR